MTDSTLKSVIVLDPESQAYRPSAHNLGPSEAVTLVSDATKCRACKKAAEAAA